MKKGLLVSFVLLLCLFATEAFAQRTVTGQVTDETGSPIPGVSVIEKGTVNGAATDFNGNYSIKVSSDDATLLFKGVGVTEQEIYVGSQTFIGVSLQSDVTKLGEVVVTAVGIEREKASLGYATQEFNADLIEQKGTTNVLGAMQGKVAGVNITGSSGAPGSSTNINIRGITSFTGSNQPLFIIDGIPMSNDTEAFGNTLFSAQASNRASDINPDMIESINVLKGPAAAALYGSRASAGAIIITTKAAKINRVKKNEVTFASSLLFQDVYGLPALQNQFGQGSTGVFNELSTLSWGYPFGREIGTVNFTAYGEQPYAAVKDNVRNFFKRGQLTTNTVTMSGNDGKSGYLLALGHTEQQGIIPNSYYERINAQLGGTTTLTNGLKIGASVTYTNSKQDGTILGNGGSAFGQLTRIPRSFDLMGLPFNNPANNQSLYFSPAINNPRWAATNVTSRSVTDRFTGNFNLGYDITDWLSITYRAGIDTYTDRRKNTFSLGSARDPQGRVIEELFYRSELNSDLIVTLKKDDLFFEGFNASLLLGQNINQRRTQNTAVNAQTLTIPGFFNASGAEGFVGSGEARSLRRLSGYYAQMSLGYKDFLFLELTGRMDQSSTLPKSSNTFFYPAAALSFVVTELVDVDPSILSFAKVRVNYSRVGRDADPYLLPSVYVVPGYGNNLASITFPLNVGANVAASTPSNRIGSLNLTPEFTTSYEVGTNLGFFNNKLNVDFSYFYSLSKDQILNVAIPFSTGFGTRTTNIGVMRNEGIELLLNGNVLTAGDFTWDASLNFTRIRNKVLEIAPGINQFAIPGNGFIGITPSIVKDRPYGVVVSSAFERNAAGDLLINPATGGFLNTVAAQVVADPNPDWFGGITNTLSFKGINLSILFDTQQGGQLYSFSAQDQKGGGHLAMTGLDRDQPRILPGVIANGDGTFRPNNIQIAPQTYWGAIGGLASEAAVFDATRYSLRELTLGYSLPQSLLERTPFGQVSVSFVGRNLWFFAPGFPGDPEINTQGAGNIRGMDLNGPPNTRNFGFNLRFTL